MIDAALIKPVVDAILTLARKGGDAHLQANAAKAVREAIRELLLADPNEDAVEAKLAIAKAAGLLSHDVILAERMLDSVRSHRKTSKKPAKTSGKKRKKSSAGKGAAGKASKRSVAGK